MDIAELEAFGKTIKDKRTYCRFLCVWLKYAEGKTAEAIARQVGYHVRHVQRIQHIAQVNGVNTLLPNYKGGNNRLLDSVEAERAVLAGVAGAITVQPIVEAFSTAVGRPVSDKTLYALLKRHGWKAKRPRPRHPKASDEAQRLFKKPVQTGSHCYKAE
jgi:transposase